MWIEPDLTLRAWASMLIFPALLNVVEGREVF